MELKDRSIHYIKESLELIESISQMGLKVAIDAYREISLSLRKVEKEDRVLIVFAGTYSSGKSTIIKRLTRKDLKTGLNPITNEIDESILWRDARIADTPGLKSDQKTHDTKTEDFIGKADIVVWVCEADRLILASHRMPLKKIALEMNKQNRLLIVINKLDETGIAIDNQAERQKMKETKISEIRRILSECKISSELPVITISADPWQIADGLSVEKALELWNQSPYSEISEFNNFVEDLTKYNEQYGGDAKFMGGLDRTHEFLTKILLELNKIREHFVQTNQLLNLHQSGSEVVIKKIAMRANTLKASKKKSLNALLESNLRIHIDKIGKFEDLKKLRSVLDENNVNALIEDFCAENFEKTITEFDEYFDTISQQEDKKIEELYINENLTENYQSLFELFSHTTFDYKIQFDEVDHNLGEDGFFERNSEEIGKFIKTGIDELPKDYKVYHKGIYNIGKRFGIKFKPHQASNLGKNIAKGAKALPVIAGIIEGIITIWQYIRAGKKTNKLEKEKTKIINSISVLEKSVWESLEKEFDKYFNAIFQGLESHIKQLKEDKKRNEFSIIACDAFIEKLKALQARRREFQVFTNV